MGGYGGKHDALDDDGDSCEELHQPTSIYEDGLAATAVGLDGEDNRDPFYADLELTLNLAYPELLNRMRQISTVDWHRKHSTEIELAHSAVVAAMRTILNTRSIPNDLVGYLVTTAQNLASRDWKKREVDPLENSLPLLIEVVEDGNVASESEEYGDKGFAVEADDSIPGFAHQAEVERDDSDLSDPISPSAQNLGLTAAIDKLPVRQRQVLMLYSDRGHSSTQRELAEEIGITEKNFQMTLTRAGKMVCKLLKEMGFDVSDTPRWKPVGSSTPRE